MIIAIDGPAGSGKSTTARLVANRLGFLYLDTGAMYRTVALAFLRLGKPATESGAVEVMSHLDLEVGIEAGEMRVYLAGEDVTDQIRTPEVTGMASQVSALARVRRDMVAAQQRIGREFSQRGGGVVLDGRDIGTVVFPDAEVKVFMVADPVERARRRHVELSAAGRTATLENVLGEMKERDARDESREINPLRPAPDAVVLDTTGLGVEDQVSLVLDLVEARRNGMA